MPLLANARLIPSLGNISTELGLLKDLHRLLLEAQKSEVPLSTRLIQYAFFPLSSIFRQNEIPTIPDQIMEYVFLNLDLLCNDWWWTCKQEEWEQLVLFAASVLNPPNSPKARVRDDHSKDAATRCLLALMRPRDREEEARMMEVEPLADAHSRQEDFRKLALSPTFFPVLGQLVSNLLAASASDHLPLRLSALRLTEIIVNGFLDASHSPTFLPGVVSAMCKVLTPRAQGVTNWTPSDVASGALRLLRFIVVKSISDEVCIADGAMRGPLADIVELSGASTDDALVVGIVSQSSNDPPGFNFVRSASWLKGTASQVHIALNSLTHLLNHPSPSVLLEFSQTCGSIQQSTPGTLPSSQPLLLSNLLTLSVSEYSKVSSFSRNHLATSLSQDSLRIMLSLTQSSLSNLPRILPSRSDAKVRHLALQITAACRLARSPSQTAPALRIAEGVSNAIGSLLGPLGGIERWGFSLLNTLEFEIPSVAPIPAKGLLEVGSAEFASMMPSFALLELRQVESRDTFAALEEMMRSLGLAAGDKSLYSTEWFVERGIGDASPSSNAALWIACRLLEGYGDVELGGGADDPTLRRTKSLEKTCRWIVRSLSEQLSEIDEDPGASESKPESRKDSRESLEPADDLVAVEYQKGINQLTTLLDGGSAGPKLRRTNVEEQRELHAVLSLHLIAVCSSILGSKFRTVLIHSLYPVILSLVSPSSLVSSTGEATLLAITNATAYASPANLVLANFDYALNSASLHLARHNLDVRATKVLVALVNLAGNEVVSRAGDVVEECFDRLDEYHGYSVIVEGLVEVLREVVRVIQVDEETRTADSLDPLDPKGVLAKRRAELEATKGPGRIDRFMAWFPRRHESDPMDAYEIDGPVGPVPQKAWGKDAEEADEDEEAAARTQDDSQPQPTQMQALTRQIVSRSLFFLTHPSALIRARIISLLAFAVPVLRSTESALLPAIHDAWPFIINRLSDTEPFVVTEAVGLIESLVLNVGDFMVQRLWDDIWPRFRTMLQRLEEAESQSALARRRPRGGGVSVGTRTAYSVSHRMYRSLLGAMTGVMRGMDLRDALAWEVAVLCRRFLSSDAHEELQLKARELYIALADHNADLIWLVLSATLGEDPLQHSGEHEDHATAEEAKQKLLLPTFLKEKKWDIARNASAILTAI